MIPLFESIQSAGDRSQLLCEALCTRRVERLRARWRILEHATSAQCDGLTFICTCWARVVEHSELTVIRDLTAKGMVVLDIGANVGFYATRMATWVGPTRLVLAFEPDPFNFACCRNAPGKARTGISRRITWRSETSAVKQPHVERHLVDICPLDAFLAKRVREGRRSQNRCAGRGSSSAARSRSHTGDIKSTWIEFRSHISAAPELTRCGFWNS
jgi:hypothetical protein